MAKQNFFTNYKSIVAFLILEILALVSFTFANISDVLFIFGFLISAFAFLFAYCTSNCKKEYLKVLPPVALLFIVGGIAGFGGFSHSFGVVSNISVFVALPSFFAMGFFTRRLGEIKLEHILMAIGFGIALLTLIGTFATWISYGPFYSLIYKIKGTTNYYYNGTPYDVTKEMSWLFGFNIKEGSVAFGGTFAIIAAAFLPSILFIDRKADRTMFVSALTIGTIGTISLLSVPNIKGLCVLVVIFIFCLVYKFLKGKKAATIIGYSFIGVIALGVLFFILAIVNAACGFVFKGFLNRVFVGNGIMQGPADVLRAAFDKTNSGQHYNLFGFDLSYQTPAFLIGLEEITFKNTGIFEIQIIKEVGIIGAFLFIAFLCAMIFFVVKYLKEDNDKNFIKTIIVSILLGFFAYSSISNEIVPAIHDGNYEAFLRSPTLIICLFLLGLIYFATPGKEENKQ